MTKKILLLVVVLIVAAALYWYFGDKGSRDNRLSSEIAAELEIAESSIEGEVLLIDKRVALVRTGRVERTPEGNKFVEYNKTVVFADQGEMISRIKVGDRVVFYGEDGETFLTKRLEVLR